MAIFPLWKDLFSYHQWQSIEFECAISSSYLRMLGLLAVEVALTDSGVKGGPPGEVLNGQEGDRGLHAHTGPQQVLQGLQKQWDLYVYNRYNISQYNSQILQCWYSVKTAGTVRDRVKTTVRCPMSVSHITVDSCKIIWCVIWGLFLWKPTLAECPSDIRWREIL